MAPLITELKKHPSFEVKVCVTGQHREMLDQVLDFFQITPDYDLDLMKKNQTLFDITRDAISGLEPILDEVEPDNIFVQGDTTTAFIGALAGYYKKIDVSHIEAGLRSGDLYSPFPEEGNRLLVGRLTKYHFVPTPRAENNLKNEGLKENIINVGNTVIDALFLGLDILKQTGEEAIAKQFTQVNLNKRVILVTGHRRESFGDPFYNICNAIKTIATKYEDVEIVYPVHLNPNVRKVVNEVLEGIDNVHLIEPLSYQSLIWLMNKCHIVLTDSGGIQEEAPSLGKPVLVMRDVTERQEGIEAGTAKLVGTNKDVILNEAFRLLDDSSHYENMAKAVNPYGDGTTSKQVASFFLKK